MPITLSIACYGVAWALLFRAAKALTEKPPVFFIGLLFMGLVAHAWGVASQVMVPGGYQFSFIKIVSAFFWVANLLIVLASLRNPLHNLLLLTLPATIVALFTSLYTTANAATAPSDLTTSMITHIMLSVAAYSTMIVATVQALALAYQNHKIRNKHPAGIVRLLPPLETMEALLFQLLWVGQALLTAVMVTGILQVESMSAQHLSHKIVFTACAWITYAILLWGRHTQGWRGNSAIRWTLSGFGFLFLAYIGTKFVLELILQTNATI